ncbi:MAG: hypothetical protein IIY23_06010, partial [Erysipelotrichaceae bacterium]|nr:hypothetical protein [Erysipelotrichaceae bacterium]
PVESKLPFVIQLKAPEMTIDKVYTVFSLNENGEIVSLPCRRSTGYLRFLAINEGPYMVMSRNSDDKYTLEDIPETINTGNMDPDNQKIFFMAGIYGILSLYVVLMIASVFRNRDRKKQIRLGFRDSVR